MKNKTTDEEETTVPLKSYDLVNILKASKTTEDTDIGITLNVISRVTQAKSSAELELMFGKYHKKL
jgi:hypothetical protein